MKTCSEVQALLDEHLDPKALLDTYTGENSGFLVDSVQWIFTRLNKTVSSGSLKGETLIQFSIGPYFPYLLPVSECFTEIIIAGATDKGVAEVEKWRTNAPGAIDFSHAAKLACELQGNREPWTEKQNMLQRKIIKALKYDLCNSNPLSPTLLPPADCLFLKHCLECHMPDKEGFCGALKNVTKLIKKGGHLIMIACLEQTYYMVDNFKFPNLPIDEATVRTALLDAGWAIEELEVLRRNVNYLYDVADYTGIIYVKALKK
ncbi:nicotinamide N-methyltransferase-like isoform X1 [Pleurodeles waltl]|uniref:nicotinamide N-methyltransferase-like isoform X1 n=1 Tax=Pleurodeles waltl TaxID=8319 RepID=UPI0037098D0D